jgi:hypothetical protein
MELRTHAGNFIGGGKIVSLGRCNTRFDPFELPRIDGEVVLHGLGDEQIAGAAGHFSKPVEAAEPCVIELYGKSGGHDGLDLQITRHIN